MTKNFDITIFGATGLTGKYIVEQVYDLATKQPSAFPSGFTWAIAGRAEGKLKEIRQELSDKYPNASIQPPTALVANIVRREQLDDMTLQSTVLINAVGPFRFMGEYVVRSCVEQQCHYVDVTGEPEFVERMQRTYHKQAVDKQVTIVHSCGFDSVPTDMGVLWMKQLYTSRGWTPTQIEMFFKLHVGPAGLRGGYATYESAVHGFGSVELLREIRKASELTPLPRPVGPKLKFHKHLTRDKQLGYHVPFVFADPSIVRLSQQLFLTGYATTKNDSKKASMPPTVQFTAYCLLPSLWVALVYYLYAFVFSFLASSPWGRQLLLRYPEQFSAGVFSRDHPTQEQLQQTSFEITLRSEGYQSLTMAGIDPKTTPLNAELTSVVRGPEPGYAATPRITLQCALTLLQNRTGNIPYGVLTPSAAFWNTNLIERLATVDITFEEVY
ncbi:saccharopine dehydrogenase [Halteromyces radiatus]|uniref:saccharopine dehydrogenase n=1 Tax=Halteromyces radiatus TaxID=101107 RepID=UPI00221F8F20|nr:saccharopine dehydrogenase [Halteromyces radiatus]KAI8081336.1 saccharopine dehydrogenase [Halteromyces radiatus]